MLTSTRTTSPGVHTVADIQDISTVIASALEEVSVSGKLDVIVDGEERVVSIGDKGDDVVVRVVVEEAGSAVPRRAELVH